MAPTMLQLLPLMPSAALVPAPLIVVLLPLPLAASGLARERSAEPLERAAAWLERNTRPIEMTVPILFGSSVLGKGIAGLIG